MRNTLFKMISYINMGLYFLGSNVKFFRKKMLCFWKCANLLLFSALNEGLQNKSEIQLALWDWIIKCGLSKALPSGQVSGQGNLLSPDNWMWILSSCEIKC